MAYAFIESRIMPKQSIASTASTAQVPVGTIVRAKDPTLGEGEFIYLQTIASVTVGGLVTYRTLAAGSSVIAMTGTGTNQASAVGVGMVAGVASTYAWFQISGTAPVKKVASIISANLALFVGATTGRVRKLSSAGKSILGMRSVASVAGAISSVNATFNRPHLQGA